jgi:hypothetical protein
VRTSERKKVAPPPSPPATPTSRPALKSLVPRRKSPTPSSAPSTPRRSASRDSPAPSTPSASVFVFPPLSSAVSTPKAQHRAGVPLVTSSHTAWDGEHSAPVEALINRRESTLLEYEVKWAGDRRGREKTSWVSAALIGPQLVSTYERKNVTALNTDRPAGRASIEDNYRCETFIKPTAHKNIPSR